MASIENKDNFNIYHIDNLIDIYNNLKEKYKLLGFMDNTTVVNFIQIILSNLYFNEINFEDEESDNDSIDDNYIE
jgi:hypothetical protein